MRHIACRPGYVSRGLRLCTNLATFFAFICTSTTFAASVATDRLDYPPGDTVWITGTGFKPSVPLTTGEFVEMSVRHITKSGLSAGEYGPWTAHADPKGNFASFWVVPYNDSIVGATLELTATGLTSGLVATTQFTDANVLLTLTTVIPDTICPGDTAAPGSDSLYLCARLLQGNCGLPLAGRPIRFYWNAGNCGVDNDAEGEDTVMTDANGYACTDMAIPDASGSWVLRVKFDGEDKPNPCPTPGNSACDPNDSNASKRCVTLSNSNICESIVIDTVACCTAPLCSLGTLTSPAACTPDSDFVSFTSSDPDDGLAGCVLYGPGELVPGGWLYEPVGGETVNVRIVCTNLCGDSCVTEFSRTYSTRVQITCLAPNDTTIVQCDPTEVSLPASAVGATCELANNSPGALVNGNWVYTPSGDETVNVSIRCISTDFCDTCTASFSVTFDVNAKPSITCPPDLAFECDSIGDLGSPVVNDDRDANPTVYILSRDSIAGNCLDAYTLRLRYVVKDGCGDSAYCDQSITVGDTTPPEIVCPPDITIECDNVGDNKSTLDALLSRTFNDLKQGPIGALPYGNPTVTDNCDSDPTFGIIGAVLVESDSCNLVYRITYAAIDDCQNVDSCRQLVTITDTTAPTFDCPPDTTFECNSVCKAAIDAGDWKTAFGCVKGSRPFNVADNCDNEPVVETVGFEILDSLCPQIIEWRIVARDHCGNTSDTCYWTWTITDTTAPTMQCPDPIRISCEQLTDTIFDGPGLGWPLAIDNCDPKPEIRLIGYDRLTDDCPYVVRRAWVAIDTCGNVSDTCYQDITVYDETRPEIRCPEAQFFECDVDTTLFAWPIAKDNCDPEPRIELIHYSKDQIGECSYVLVRGWHAVDDCGNYSDTCRQVITVGDTTDPVITCPPDTIVDCAELPETRNGSPKVYLDSFVNGVASKSPNGCYDYDFRFGLPTATDNCDDILDLCLESVHLTDSDSCQWVYTLIFTARDDCDNISDICSQRVIFTDTTPPVVICAPDTTVYCENVPPCFDGKSGVQKLGEKFLCDFRLIDTVYDACDREIEYSYSLSYHFEKCPRYIRATIWAVDDCGNISDTCLWTVYFDDTVAPVIACPPNIEAECGTNPGDWGQPTATDDCGQPTIALIDIDTVAQNSCFLEVTRTFAATDFCGNADTCTQHIVIGDSTDPVITCPRDTVVNCEDLLNRDSKALLAGLALGAPKSPTGSPCLEYDYRYGTPTATDNCSEYRICLYRVDHVYSDSCRTVFELHFAAVDECGNYDTCSQRVTFIDNEGPTLICAPDTTIYCDRDKAACIQLKGEEPFKLVSGDKFLCGFRMVDTVYDGCCEDVETFVRLTYHLNKCPAYIKAFIWAVDCCGNYSDTCTWILNIADTSAPVITCPPNLTYQCDQVQGDWGWPTATDNCTAAEIKLFDQDTVVNGCQTVITRTFTATDRCLNQSRCAQTITITDGTPPVCRLPVNDTIFLCDLDTTICLPVSATDKCDQSVECSVSDGAGFISNGKWCYTPTQSGPVTAYIHCLDDCGNGCDGNFTITFVINVPPVCNVPNDTTIYLCDPGVITLPVSSTDANQNLVGCVLADDSPGELVNTDHGYFYNWNYSATKDEKFCVTVRCYDSCGAYCEDQFCVIIDVTEPPVCYQTPDTTIALCNPVEVCLVYDWLDPVVNKSSDAANPTKGGKNKTSGPKQLPNVNNPGSPINKTILGACDIVSGPGYLKGDYWCWTPPDFDTSVTVTIVCADTCGHNCTNEFTVNFDMNVNPVCSILVDLVDPICTPETDFVPYNSTDPDGTTECYLVGPGALVAGGWQLADPEPGTSVTVKIVCADTCGDSCVIDFTRNYPERVPVICRVPENFDTLLCQPTTLSLPVSGGENSRCSVVSGPGEVSQGNWTYYADHDTSFCVTIECKSLCDSCRAEFCVNVEMNDPPVCSIVNDTTYFQCAPTQVCRPVSATDPNGNLTGCAVVVGPGTVSGGNWCYTPLSDETVNETIRCTDACGLYCEESFSVTFNINEAPACVAIADTSYFQCVPTQVCRPVSATDADGNLTGCAVFSGPGTVSGGNWCYTPSGDETVNVTIRCTDACGAFCDESFAVTVDLNEPPVINLGNDISVLLTGNPQQVCFNYTVSDPDGLAGLKEYLIVAPPGATIDTAQNRICWTPELPGLYEFRGRVVDPCGLSNIDAAFVLVGQPAPPICNLPGDTTILSCNLSQISLPVSASSLNLPVNCVVTSGPGSISGGFWRFTPPGAGEYNVTITCTDNAGARCSGSFKVTVEVNNQPVCNVRDTSVFLCGPGNVCIPVSATDYDADGNLIPCPCELTSGPGILQNGMWCYNATSDASFSVTFRCTDVCGASCTKTVNITINMNEPPICSAPSDTTFVLCPNQAASLTLNASDPDGNITGYQLISGPGSISGNVWSYLPPSENEIIIKWRVLDACGKADTCQTRVIIQFNDPPTFTIRDDTTITVCSPGPVCRLLNIQDQNNNVTTVQVTSGVGTINQQGNSYSWCFTPTANGTYSSTVRVTDACNRTVQRTFNTTFIIVDPPACNLPASGSYIFCQSPVCLPIAGNNPPPQRGVTCQIIDGPGSISNGNYCISITGSRTFTVVIRCTNTCGAQCQISRNYTFSVDPKDCNGPAGIGPDGQVVTMGLQAGDVDGSGEINIADLALLTQIVHRLNRKASTAAISVGAASAGYSNNADVNCDGHVDRADVAFLTEYIFSAGPAPCVPEE